MTTDLTKPVQIADGRKARVICTDRVGLYSIIVLVMEIDGSENVMYFKPDCIAYYANLNLINIDTTPKNLRIAREAVAHILEALGYALTAQDYRDGKHDNCTDIRAALKALEMVA